ncbi:MAG: C-terminal target protein, partial [Chitinophagaceae bacterium]|nr:C-terminal target protein [Chitinophagaceae bacterium]
MLKITLSSFLLLFFLSLSSFSQCLSSLPPPACTGTEPLVVEAEVVGGGTTKWYYGSALTMNTLTLDGGTLVV